MVKLKIERDTVHASDEFGLTKSMEIYSGTSIELLMEHLIHQQEFELPRISGGNVLWNVQVEDIYIAQVVETKKHEYIVYTIDDVLSNYSQRTNTLAIKFSHIGKYEKKFTEAEMMKSVFFLWSPNYFYRGTELPKWSNRPF